MSKQPNFLHGSIWSQSSKNSITPTNESFIGSIQISQSSESSIQFHIQLDVFNKGIYTLTLNDDKAVLSRSDQEEPPIDVKFSISEYTAHIILEFNGSIYGISVVCQARQKVLNVFLQIFEVVSGFFVTLFIIYLRNKVCHRKVKTD